MDIQTLETLLMIAGMIMAVGFYTHFLFKWN